MTSHEAATAPMSQIVRECGYWWEEGDVKQNLHVIELSARMAAHWRNKVNEAEAGVARERMYQHLAKRERALATKLANVRKAAIEYRRTRDFYAVLRDVKAKQEATDAAKT